MSKSMCRGLPIYRILQQLNVSCVSVVWSLQVTLTPLFWSHSSTVIFYLWPILLAFTIIQIHLCFDSHMLSVKSVWDFVSATGVLFLLFVLKPTFLFWSFSGYSANCSQSSVCKQKFWMNVENSVVFGDSLVIHSYVILFGLHMLQKCACWAL